MDYIPGLCRCGARIAVGRKACEDCKVAARRRAAKLYQARNAEEGRCAKCYSKAAPGRALCKAHLARERRVARDRYRQSHDYTAACCRGCGRAGHNLRTCPRPKRAADFS